MAERDGATLAYYDQAAIWGPARLTEAEAERIETTLALVPGGSTSAIDVGCGDGRLTNRLAERLERVVGVDIAPEALAHVRAETLRAGAGELPVDDRSFDLAVCTELLEHLPDAEHAAATRELARVARRHVLIGVPNAENLENAEGCCPACGEVFHVFRHERRYVASDMRSLLPGFALRRVVTHGPSFWPPRTRDVRVQQRLGAYQEHANAVCPSCSHAGTEAPRRAGLARLVRASRRLPPGRQRRQWMLALYERDGEPGPRGGSGRKRPEHLLLTSYLFPPSDASAVRRVVGIRNALDGLGVRTTVLTSRAGGSLPDDHAQAVVRTADVRARLAGRQASLAGLGAAPIAAPGRRRLTRLAVPDTTSFTWAPGAVRAALRLVRDDRPDLVFTTSPPESVHLVGLALARASVPWIADLRDGWTFEPPTARPYARWLDGRVERSVVRRADRVTAVTEPIVDDLERRYGTGTVIHLTNGFDPVALASASDERALLDGRRLSLVYTGSGEVDGKNLGGFLRAVELALECDPGLRERLEVVLAGIHTEAERQAIESPALAGVVRSLGRLEHRRALGLQQAADGLVLITHPTNTQVATAKVFEYLAARKPVLALARGNAAERLLDRAGGHSCVQADDEVAIADALRGFVERWGGGRETYTPRAGFDPDDYSFERIAGRLLDIAEELATRVTSGTL